MKGKRAAGGCLILALLFLLLFLVFSGLTIVLETPWFLVTGWLYFLVRVLPQVRVNVEAVVAAFLVAGALFAGLHAVLSRIDRHMRSDEPSAPWRLRSTAAFLGLFVAMLLCSMASIGAAHHIGWMFSGGKLTYSNLDIEPFPALRAIRPLCESFARSSGDVYERARVFGPIRETHHVLVKEGSTDVLMFERNPQNPQVSYTMFCASDGEVHVSDFDRDKALEMFRLLGRSPTDGGVPDALEGGAAP